MDETEKYIRSLLQQQGIEIPYSSEAAFREFFSDQDNINNVKSIRSLQEKMTKSWQVIARREEIKGLQIALPNGNAGKPYETNFNLNYYGLDDITFYELTGFEDTGLEFDRASRNIIGVPAKSGDIVLQFAYNFDGEPEDAPLNQKKITIIVNPDPKSLWKDIPSDANDRFAKADNVTETASLLNKTLIVSSKRGRSHANKGSFRDDDYAFAQLESGWAVIAVSDGAGSAEYSRKGSAVACASVVNYFSEKFTKENTVLLDEAVTAFQKDDTIKGKLQDIVNPHLLEAAKKAYTEIEFLAKAIEAPMADFHATLAFVLTKEYSGGYAFFSFGVGDCPSVLVDKNFDWIKPLNSLDVGEFGGGTRFITMPEIFKNENLESRCNFEFTGDFPYLVLMSDGIYDPKFEVESNLAKPERWKQFFDDLRGNNEEKISLGFNDDTAGLNEKLSQWMDFWSPGNHDDRTLAILF